MRFVGRNVVYISQDWAHDKLSTGEFVTRHERTATLKI
jgi:hypothetical protein